ncbi:MAG: hypothetical protein MI746_15370 [Pseudomonadales bacterium]|nr:hypothetical protein [Pseudomonadales bacterium]
MYILLLSLLVASSIFGSIVLFFVDTGGGLASVVVDAMAIVFDPQFFEQWLWLFISLVILISYSTPD